MTNLFEYLKRHQLVTYFVLTYIFSSILWMPFNGNIYLLPVVMLGAFSPALVGIGLSAILNPQPRQDNCKPAVIAFIVAWILTNVIIIMYLITVGGFVFSTSLVVMSVITGLLSALVVSSAFSAIPGIRAHLHTLIKPSGHPGYYLLALVLYPTIELLGIILSRAFGMEISFLNYPAGNVNFLWVVILFFYQITYVGLCEEPGWRGFVLPRLQEKFSPLVSSLILGILWAVWHTPTSLEGIKANNLSDTLLQTLVDWSLKLVVTVIFTCFYNRTKGSILAVALLHAAMNTAGILLTGSLCTVILFVAFMIFVIALDRMWKKPTNNLVVYGVSVHEAA